MFYQCSLCSFSTSFSVSYQNHLQNVHGTSARKDEAQPTYFCELCSVSAPDKRAFQQHLLGKKHLKACTGAQVTIRPRRDSDSTSNGTSARKDEAQPMYFCELCSISVPDKQIFQQHLEGKKHKRACVAAQETMLPSRDSDSTSNGTCERKDEGQPMYFCELCSVSVPDKQIFQQHLEGKKHKRACIAAQETMLPRRDSDSTSNGFYLGNLSYFV